MIAFDWAAAGREAGVRADDRFNAGTIALPQERALVWCRADGTTQVLSGADLHALAGRLAAALHALGVRRDDRVAGLLGRRPEAFALPLAVWRLGAVYVPLFSGFGRDALRVRMTDSGSRVLVVDAPNAAGAAACRDLPGVTVAEVDGGGHADVAIDDVAAGDEPEAADTHRRDAATIMYTSGTTGAPKGCVIPHHGIVSLRPYVDHCLAAGPRDVLFSTADTGWSFGLYTTGLAPLACGATRLLYEGGFDAGGWWAAARGEGATHFASAPTGYRQLAAAGDEALGEPFASLQAGTSAGEPLTPEVVGWFRERFGFTIHDSYGLTELGMVLAQLRGPAAPEPRAGTVGHALPGFDVALLGPDGEPVGDGEIGSIAVRDNGWLLGIDYWGRSDEWAARLRDGWWCTEDLARREDDGSYVYVARNDDMIVTAGYNVGPADVESALLEHPAIVDAACVGEPDDRKGQVVAAHVVLAASAPGDAEALLAELRPWVGERLGWHAAPRRLHLATALPRTESGKVRRRLLREAAR